MKKENVMVFINEYDKNPINSYLKKVIIDEYCDRNGYQVIKTDTIEVCKNSGLIDCIVSSLLSLNTNISKIILFSVDDLTDEKSKLFIVNSTLNMLNIKIETVNEGKLDYDITFQKNLENMEV